MDFVGRSCRHVYDLVGGSFIEATGATLRDGSVKPGEGVGGKTVVKTQKGMEGWSRGARIDAVVPWNGRLWTEETTAMRLVSGRAGWRN